MTSVIVTVFVFAGGFGVGLGAAVTLGAFKQTEATQRSAASAERGILASWEALGQLTTSTTGLGVGVVTGLAADFGAGLGAGFGFGGTGTVRVFVTLCVAVDPADELVDPTQTVTDPDPNLEP